MVTLSSQLSKISNLMYQRSSTPARGWDDLPTHVQHIIFTKLEDGRDLARCSAVSKSWQQSATDPRFRQTLFKARQLYQRQAAYLSEQSIFRSVLFWGAAGTASLCGVAYGVYRAAQIYPEICLGVGGFLFVGIVVAGAAAAEDRNQEVARMSPADRWREACASR